MNQYQNLIILGWSNYDERIHDLFDVSFLIDVRIKVTFVDVSEITIKGYHIPGKFQPEGLAYEKILSESDLKSFIKMQDNDNTLYLLYMTYCRFSYNCFRLLSKMKCKQIYCSNGVFPSIPLQQRFSVIFSKVFSQKFPGLLRSAYVKVLMRTKLIAPINYYLETCQFSANTNECKIGNQTHIVKFNSTDYQRAKKDSSLPISDRYLVFLDQNLPFHPDGKLEGIVYDSDDYFERMNCLFSKLEEKYSCEIIIAAHPTVSRKCRYNDFWGNRKVLFNETAPLVKHSMGVIAHYSTAIGYAVIWEKPILFVYTDDMKIKANQSFLIEQKIGELLNSPVVRLNDYIADDLILTVDKEAFGFYKYGYLTNEDSEKRMNGEILMDILKSC